MYNTVWKYNCTVYCASYSSLALLQTSHFLICLTDWLKPDRWTELLYILSLFIKWIFWSEVPSTVYIHCKTRNTKSPILVLTPGNNGTFWRSKHVDAFLSGTAIVNSCSFFISTRKYIICIRSLCTYAEWAQHFHAFPQSAESASLSISLLLWEVTFCGPPPSHLIPQLRKNMAEQPSVRQQEGSWSLNLKTYYILWEICKIQNWRAQFTYWVEF